ncbi:insulinase family protein, partial [Candidatus Daviesbacteria bacterium]|nr:insulinase family protein [Candidatus Daviesbacteria bacterium]
FDHHKITAEVLSAILGGCSSSRLFYEIRDLRGLSYDIAAGHLAYSDTGVFTIQTAFKTKNMKKGLKIIIDEIEKISSQKVSEKELSDVKEMIKGTAAIAREQTNYVANRLAIDYLFEQKVVSPKEYNEQIDEVSADDVLKVAQMIFKKENFNLQIVGPFKDVEPFQKILSH